MLSTKMRPNPPLEWGDKLVVGLKEPKATQKNLGPKTFQNFPIELNWKWQASFKNLKENRNNEIDRKAFDWNTEKGF